MTDDFLPIGIIRMQYHVDEYSRNYKYNLRRLKAAENLI